nr:ATP-dependent DNA helicase [Thiorhodovibrio winogradskyi]
MHHFGVRPQQLAMATTVAEEIAEGGTLICEAGTGTGKTLAYLIPALLCGRKVVISTGTRTLQDQLFHQDLPLARRLLGIPVRVALLKGRANYLCLQRLEQTGADRAKRDPGLRVELASVRDWARVTRSGDVAESGLPERSPLWPLVTSTADNCLGQDCAHWGDCHLVVARRQAQEADLVVINHHLLCADMALRQEGLGEVLPGADCFVIDEAHQLPEVAGVFFGRSLSSYQLLDFARDLSADLTREARGLIDLSAPLEQLRPAVQSLRLAFGTEDRRSAWAEISAEPRVQDARAALGELLEQIDANLETIAGHSKTLDRDHERCRDLRERLELFAAEETTDQVRWLDAQGRGFRLHQTPLEVASSFQAHRARLPAAWVFTSATLAVGESFTHFARQMGLEDARTARWESPFDHARQALWLTPPQMPEPADATHDASVAELVRELAPITRGRMFVLFTSHRALQQVARLLEGALDYPLLVHGQAPRAELIRRFREHGNAVLLGSASFWEGVDVRGEALSCVIVDKLPFASPADPVVRARIDALREAGGQPFRDFQLPRAVIALKQGAGRLIRDTSDRGLFVLCDPRLASKPYGAAFVKSLPPMTRTESLADVRAFFGTSLPPSAPASTGEAN